MALPAPEVGASGAVVGSVPEPPVVGVLTAEAVGTGVGVETAVGVGCVAVEVGWGELPGFTVGVAGGCVAPGPAIVADGRGVAAGPGTPVPPGGGVAVAARAVAVAVEVAVEVGFAPVVAVGCPGLRVGDGAELRSGAVRWSIAASSWAASMMAGFSGANLSCGGEAE